MIQNDSKRYNLQNDSKWYKMIQNVSECFKMIQNDLNWMKNRIQFNGINPINWNPSFLAVAP